MFVGFCVVVRGVRGVSGIHVRSASSCVLGWAVRPWMAPPGRRETLPNGRMHIKHVSDIVEVELFTVFLVWVVHEIGCHIIGILCDVG